MRDLLTQRRDPGGVLIAALAAELGVHPAAVGRAAACRTAVSTTPATPSAPVRLHDSGGAAVVIEAGAAAAQLRIDGRHDARGISYAMRHGRAHVDADLGSGSELSAPLPLDAAARADCIARLRALASSAGAACDGFPDAVLHAFHVDIHGRVHVVALN